ncbi:23247_t:CDS:10 [Rhizophagus irregularis]|nr:23247_t:CDS:10 [Rhizophagus irregularis]
MRFKCFLSEDEISSKSYIIVLQPERNKYLKWELPSPQATADLIKSENIKLPVKSYTIFKLNCASAIRESHNFITDTREVEIIKTTIAIWNCAEENIKEKYNQLNMNLRDLESPAHSELPEVTPEVVAQDCKINLVSPSTKLSLEWALVKREKSKREALKWNKIFNTEFIPIRRVLQLSECRKERKKVLKREFRAIKKERSPVAYSLNLFQQLDKDIFGTIKRGIEELEKTKVAKCNQGDKMFF